MGRSLPFFIFPLVIGAFTAVSYTIFVLVYRVQPTAFIDEVFHIPQAQRYCDWKFYEWDDKITTLPGLYLFSVGLNGPVSWLLGRRLCDVFALRLTNLVAATFLLSTVHKILVRLHGNKVDDWKLMLTAVNLSILPVLYWFTFLYYTDVLSTLVVLVMVLLHLHAAPYTASAMGVVAVMVRQSNIIWVLMLAASQAAEVMGIRTIKAPIQNWTDVKAVVKKLKRLAGKPQQLAELLADVFADCFGYGMVLMGFLGFVSWNGGFVVGDRSAHVATFHGAQAGYFCLFVVLFSVPYAVGQVKPFLRACQRSHLATAVVMGLAGFLVHNTTLVHPYLLADNRHYTFYLWNRLYGPYEFVRYLMVPVYVWGGYICLGFVQHRSTIFKFTLAVCIAASIVPQKLLEPRYFIVPFLMLRLHSVPGSWWKLWMETVYFVLINVASIYIFTHKTFQWEDLSEPQRIIW